MPIQSFLLLVIAVIAAAGATIVLMSALGVSFAWLGLAALALAIVVRGLAWR